MPLAALPDAHWDALSPGAPLRRWRLIEVGTGSSVTSSPLRIDERVLHYLAGVIHLDERLAGVVERVEAPEDVAPSHQALAERVAAPWRQAANRGALPVVQLCGPDAWAKRAVAAAACARLGLILHSASASVIPPNAQDLNLLIRLWEREAALAGSALFPDCDDEDGAESLHEGVISRFVEGLRSPLIVTTRERNCVKRRISVVFDVTAPTAEERRVLWDALLGPAAGRLNGAVDALVSQFNLGAPAMRAACMSALGDAETSGGDAPALLWDACRAQARPRMSSLAQRTESAVTWDDLVLPEAQVRVLREIAVHLRHRVKVYRTWGFAAKGARGLGISALFAGPSGTGKTMAAEVLANELRLDLYRIDLSQVVSKYIGETEKNLRSVFDAAEDGGAILLFDEADALFGKRSEVKDSHDRYANIEISYLLQRMEAYRGLAILTTNMKSALDPAFLRRIRFVAQFPFPDATLRAGIWQRVFPNETPTNGLDTARLAQLNVAGGNIRNIALHAAFLAADADTPVAMAHILRAANTEYAKLERPLTDAETKRLI